MNPSETKVGVGTVIDNKYKVVSSMGQGGMGEVFKVAHIHLGKIFALKVVKFQDVDADIHKIVRFNREAKVLAKLQHPNIVMITDFGVINNKVPYLVMDYIEGITLRELINNKKVIGYVEALDITKQIAAGLYQAHIQGIIHRDLKPENIMIQQLLDGQIIVRILDFGIAKIVSKEEGEVNISKDGSLGTLKYMSYEQAMGEEVDLRTDIYSLSLILFEMITGNTTSFMLDDAKMAHELVNNLPYEVSQIIHKGLSKFADKRQQTALELRREIEAFEMGVSFDDLLQKNSNMSNLMDKPSSKQTKELKQNRTNSYKLISNTHEGKKTNKAGENSKNSSSGEINKSVEITADTNRKSFGKYKILLIALFFALGISLSIYHFVFNQKTGKEEVKNTVKVDPPMLVSISSNTFNMGSNKGKDIYAKPEHLASISVFYVAKKMVTNQEYAEFIKDTGHTPPVYWQEKKPPAYVINQPVTQVNWKDATAYCEWLSEKTGHSFRLLLEKEWEYLARNKSKYDIDILNGFSEWTGSSLQAYPDANKDLAQKIEAANKEKNNKIKIFRGINEESESDPTTFRLFQIDTFTNEKLGFRVARN